MVCRWIAIAGLALIAATGAALADSADDAFGVWRHPENGSHVEMYKCGNRLCGKITKIADGQKTDDKNPNADLRGRSIIGLVILSDAEKTGANGWSGALYNRQDGATYTGKISMKSKNAMDLSGCTAIVFCKTVTWTRVK